MSSNLQDKRVDPIQKAWIWIVFGILFFLMAPVWPMSGFFWGIPVWTIWAVGISLLTSIFTAYVIFKIWREPRQESASPNLRISQPPLSN